MNELASVMDAMPFPILAANEGGYYVYENEAAGRFLGFERAELVGKQLTDLIAYDPTMITATLERLKLQGHLSGRTRYRHADGSLREADVNIFGHDLTDGTRVFVSLIHPLPGVSAEWPEVLQAGSGHELSNSEMRLLHLIAEGFSDEQMGALLGHTSDEVGLQVQGVLTKMTAASRTEAVVRALKTHIIL
jgi:PAS domain S-box-containing protein